MDATYRFPGLRNKPQCFAPWDRTCSLVFLPAGTRRFEYPGGTWCEGLTACDPERLTIGASRLLVRFTERTSAFCLSSFDDEIVSCWLLASGSEDLALLIRLPSSCGAARFDISLRGALNKDRKCSGGLSKSDSRRTTTA
jgi:hypothetical protein